MGAAQSGVALAAQPLTFEAAVTGLADELLSKWWAGEYSRIKHDLVCEMIRRHFAYLNPAEMPAHDAEFSRAIAECFRAESIRRREGR